MLDSHLIASTQPIAKEKQVFYFGNVRITVLASELIRCEYSDKGSFCDKATQIVWFRDLGECEAAVEENERYIVITTESVRFFYDKEKCFVTEAEIEGKRTFFDPSCNLLGTTRTLDRCKGEIKPESGIIAKNGLSFFSDDSLILDDDGMVKAREKEEDLYFFATKEPLRALKLFYSVTGDFPMLPRYALGNWWSRFHRYKQDEYLSLMDKFADEDLPFTVATLDMDWHWVLVGLRFGYFNYLVNDYFSPLLGWTGYTWNSKLFPDYKQLLAELKKRNLHITLNLHPASGVRRFEKQYPDMRKAMGLKLKSRRTIQFDITNSNFINAYFSVLHKPYEREGVDFWWIDWQQGTKSKLKDYDPLWACNHYHFLDSAANGNRPLILSRYSGLGSHRYPLGFSGDTVVSWKVLNMLPYFTANAANVGYTDWSHDIGGHMGGEPYNDELYLRWLQFGVFSPINRLHSCNSSLSKEPWKHKSVETQAREQLRLRHRLIPYLYTAYYRNYKDCIPLIAPLYYFSKDENAYHYPNVYHFGSELIVAPVTSPVDEKTGLAEVSIWLPEGNYTDIFTGEKLVGGKHTVKRTLASIPVYAKEGAILPFSCNKGNDSGNPYEMDIWIYGGNNKYTLYEDDGISEDYRKNIALFTDFTISKKGEFFELSIATRGERSLAPKHRRFNLIFKEYDTIEPIEITVDGKPLPKSEICYSFDNIAIDFDTSTTLKLKIRPII